MGIGALHYDALAQQFAAQGFIAVSMELRGIGSSSIRASRKHDFAYPTLVEQELPAAIHEIKRRYPNQAITLFGHSLGGQLAALYLSQNRNAANGLIICASGTVYHGAWQFPANLAILMFTVLSSLIASVFGYFPGKKIGFGGCEAKTLIKDWSRSARSGKYQFKSSAIDYESDLQYVTCPVLAINLADDRFAPDSATAHFLAKLSPSRLQRSMLTAAMLGSDTADHFSWMKQPKEVARTIRDWHQTL